MKRVLYLTGILLPVLLAGGCRRSETTPQSVMDEIILPVRFNVAMNAFQTKATDTALEDGDVLGIFAGDPIGAKNVRGVVTSGTLTPDTPIKWLADQKVSTSFQVYAPFDAFATSTSLSFAVKADQTAYADYAASDLIAGSATAAPQTMVSLTLKHMLSKVVLNVTCEDATDAVQSVTLGETVLNATVDLASRTVTLGSNKGSIKAGKAVAANGGTGYVAILIPQSVRLPLTVTTTSGKTAEFVLDAVREFVSGASYTANIVVPKTAEPTQGEAVVFTLGIQDWTDGGSLAFVEPTPVVDHTGQWSVIGLNDDWTTDIWMAEGPAGEWSVDIDVTPESSFKLRRDGAWSNFEAGEVHPQAGFWNNDDNFTHMGIDSDYGLADETASYTPDGATDPVYCGNKPIRIDYTGRVHLRFVAADYKLYVTQA